MGFANLVFQVMMDGKHSNLCSSPSIDIPVAVVGDYSMLGPLL